MGEQDEQMRQAMRQATRRQLLIMVPIVLVIGGALIAVDAAIGHPMLALIWGACFVLLLGGISVFVLRR